MITLETLREKAPEIRAIAEKYGAENIRVFGSVARGDQSEDSDVDFLVDWDNQRSAFDRLYLVEEMEECLKNKVDISVGRNIHWYIKERVMSEAISL